ncbi:hypothetical protein XENORESO_013793 [Xenotaenia resolanae]|uniref:Uncharacterized protein n=1 Tax=Xenotaenia resolanae TaxID=208358 RepID=A0ABV0XB64_9TELE
MCLFFSMFYSYNTVSCFLVKTFSLIKFKCQKKKEISAAAGVPHHHPNASGKPTTRFPTSTLGGPVSEFQITFSQVQFGYSEEASEFIQNLTFLMEAVVLLFAVEGLMNPHYSILKMSFEIIRINNFYRLSWRVIHHRNL